MSHESRNYRVDGVCRRLAAKKSAAYKWVREGKLPPPIKLTPRFSIWPGAEIDAIVAAHAAGASDDDLRRIVRDLVAKRPKLPSAEA